MSGYVTHLLGYLLLAAGLTYILSDAGPTDQTLILCIFIGALYSLLPDLDLPSSVLRKVFEAAALLSIVASLSAYLVFKDIIYIYASLFLSIILYLLWTIKHRGFFHTLAAGLIFSLPLALIEPYCAVYAFTGYFAHLFLDGKMFSLI